MANEERMTNDSQQSAYDDQHLEAHHVQKEALKRAQLTRMRALQVAQQNLNAELAKSAEFWKNILKPKDDKPDV